MTVARPRLNAARGKPCPYCHNYMSGRREHHRSKPTRDHVTPRVRGGGPTIIVCGKCNNDKGELTLHEWAAILAMRHDFRAKIVASLCAELDDGTLHLALTGDAYPIGLAPGVFA